GHTERTARKKVVLDVDDDQCITLTQPFYVWLHDSPPIRANRASELRPGVAPGARPARSGLPERRQRPPDIPVSICKIGVCTLRPRACIRELWVPEVPDCELRSGGCAMAHVEAEKRVRHATPARFSKGPHQGVHEGLVSQPFDLQGEKRELLDRVQEPEIAIELHTVDHTDRWPHEHVFGLEIPVPVHDARPTRGEQSACPYDELTLLADHALNEARAYAPAGTLELAPVPRNLPLHSRDIGIRLPWLGLRLSEETSQAPAQPPELGIRKGTLLQDVIQHAVPGQATHLHEPVRDVSLAAERKPTVAAHEWHDTQIHTRCEAA